MTLASQNIMKTECIKVNENNPEAELIAQAAKIIKLGGLVAFPTETVYGLGANAFSADAAQKIYAAKGRPSDNPLIVHIADYDELYNIAEKVPAYARALMDAFWPGPMTLVFPKKACVPDATTGGLPTVAVRMPSHKTAAMLITLSGVPIAAPSANASGRPSTTTAEHVINDLDGKIEMIIDGGPCDIGLESTIIDVTGDAPVLLRPGYITVEDICRVAGSCSIDPAIQGPPKEGLRPKAPGMKYRHYAPKGEMAIISGESSKVAEYINEKIGEDVAEGRKAAVLCSAESASLYSCDYVMSAGHRDSDEEIARNLFALLRDMDEKGIEKIYAENFSDGKRGMAIMNRMLKAAGYKEVQV